MVSKLTAVIPQKELDLEYNAAKIIASPYDYKLAKRIIPRDTYSICRYFNIFNKNYETEEYLCNTLGLSLENEYLNINPDINVPDMSSCCIKEIDVLATYGEQELGFCGNLIEYNNLNIDEETLIKDLSYLTNSYSDATTKMLTTKSYLRALEVWQLKAINSDSLIPNLMYLSTIFCDKSLEELENIKFAEERITNKMAPLIRSFRVEMNSTSDTVPADTYLSVNPFLIPRGSPNTYAKEYVDALYSVTDDMFRLGLCYALTYGVELLYHFNNIKDETLKFALETLLSVTYSPISFCSYLLYSYDSEGHLKINEEVSECFDPDNEVNSNDILLNYDYYTLPIFFMKMIASMHSYAYQVARIKHATLLYKTAKEQGLINQKDFDQVVRNERGIFGGELEEDNGDSISNELINLDSFSVENESKLSDEDLISKEKEVRKKASETGPALNAADAIKKDLYDSQYDYDIAYVNNTVSNKDTYNTIANNVKMITTELSRQIKEIKTYNTGGKQNGLLVGKLDKKYLWKYKTDPHIFYNNNYKLKEMDLAFGCVLDESGSMYGEKIKNGRIVMIMLHEVLNSLGINHSIIGHTSDTMYQTKIFKYYQFKEEAHYSLEKPYGLVKATDRNGNCDSGALYYMQTVMKQVRNKDKIVIIFSDGQPTECTDLDLTRQVTAMEKAGIHVIGVGINFESIKEYYPDNANGKNLKEMVDIVVSILKRYVLEKKE